MKLSICIPIYNFDVNDLVNDLNDQIVSQNLDAKIILIDDASDAEFVQKNKPLKDIVNHFIFWITILDVPKSGIYFQNMLYQNICFFWIVTGK
jgi:hypothetical protein